MWPASQPSSPTVFRRRLCFMIVCGLVPCPYCPHWCIAHDTGYTWTHSVLGQTCSTQYSTIPYSRWMHSYRKPKLSQVQAVVGTWVLHYCSHLQAFTVGCTGFYGVAVIIITVDNVLNEVSRHSFHQLHSRANSHSKWLYSTTPIIRTADWVRIKK